MLSDPAEVWTSVWGSAADPVNVVAATLAGRASSITMHVAGTGRHQGRRLRYLADLRIPVAT